MIVYAGIDEAGYGPLFGPMVIGRAALALPDDWDSIPQDNPSENPKDNSDAQPAQPRDCLWSRLDDALCKTLSGRRGRIAVNDSKKLHSKASGVTHLERGVLAFVGQIGQAGKNPTTVDQWLELLGETTHRQLGDLPWYAPTTEHPWQNLPRRCTEGEIAIARSMLSASLKRCNVKVLDMGAAVVFENRFNKMVNATRSKASTAFTFVSGHLLHIWKHYGLENPTVIVDRQSARMRYREPLAISFPRTQIRIVSESSHTSAYHLTDPDDPKRTMTISFQVEADSRHMPVALASMIAKYTREILMARFGQWFSQKAPEIKPTAGYGTDGKRFWEQIQPQLARLSIKPQQLRRAR